MDINLHSFILVMGLLVIGFIVFDGIKKIRENKKNQLSTFDDQLDALNAEETHLHDQLAEQGYDEFEIADDLVDGAFVNDLGEELVESFDESVTSVEPSEESLEQHLQTMEEEDIGSFSATEELIEEPISSAAVESQQEYFEQDALAQYADDIEAPVSDIVDEAKDANTNNEAEFSVDNDQPENPHFTFSLKEEPEVEAPAQVKAKPKQRLSPEAAQAKKAALEAEAQAEKHEEKELAPLELDPEETVPVLMEPVELGEEVDPNPPVQHEMHLPEFVQQTLLEEPIFAKKDTAAEEQLQDYINMNLDEVSATDVPTIKAETQEVGERLSEREVAQEVFVIHVLNENGLSGLDLRRVFTACDMRFGEMNIFHRFEKANAQGKIQFSVANSLEPGSFDMDNMDALSTSGISLFMSLPGPDNAMEAFDAMAEVALVFARNFNANLCDDSHSDLTPQTLEHYRQRIRDFSRKHLSASKK